MDALLSDDQAQQLTQPHHALWERAHYTAEQWFWGDFRTKHSSQFTAMSPTARATMLNCLITEHVRRESGVVMTDVMGFPVQALSSNGLSAIVRFKLLDQGMAPRNQPTGQQDALDANEISGEVMQQLSIVGVATQPTVLTVGYQLTIGQDGMSRVLVVCRHKGAVRFWYPISDAAAGGGTVLRLPLDETPPATPRLVSKLRRGRDEADGTLGSENSDQ